MKIIGGVLRVCYCFVPQGSNFYPSCHRKLKVWYKIRPFYSSVFKKSKNTHHFGGDSLARSFENNDSPFFVQIWDFIIWLPEPRKFIMIVFVPICATTIQKRKKKKNLTMSSQAQKILPKAQMDIWIGYWFWVVLEGNGSFMLVFADRI